VSLRSIIFALVLICSASLAEAQIKPENLDKDFLVKLTLKDSSRFTAYILARPVPDRVIVDTRNGRLEIPIANIIFAEDYRFNNILKDDIRTLTTRNAIDFQSQQLTKYLSRQKQSTVSTIRTKDHDVFKGNRYQFDDTANVIMYTPYGNLFFKYPKIDYVENWSGSGDRRDDFRTSAYFTAYDRRASQTFITPTARAFGDGHVFLASYMVAGLQFNYGITDWLSFNGGGVFAPFLSPQVLTGTAGIKITPLQSDLFGLAAGFQGVYSEVVKITRIAFPYVVATYGDESSHLSIIGGYSLKNEVTSDSLHVTYTAENPLLAIGAAMRAGENLKLQTELFFIDDFDIVPAVISMRYFDESITIDAGLVFSLFTSGSARGGTTLGEYVFGTAFKLIPMVSGSYHF
jgi:hypothetical protein